ncbi:MAG: sigma factor [Burkholderiaceae bacterium]
MRDAPLEALADEELMLAYAGGDAGAFAQLYDRHGRAVYRFLLRSLHDPQLADDLLQETWLAVVRNASGYVPRALCDVAVRHRAQQADRPLAPHRSRDEPRRSGRWRSRCEPGRPRCGRCRV